MSSVSGAIKLGLARTNKLLSFLGHPEKKFRAIQITGTNGKGSTALFAHNILCELGYNSGVYTSPHILDPSERIRVGREPFEGDLSKEVEELSRLFSRRYPSARSDPPTWFEMVTALCFDYFREKRVEFAVLETGLGGRLDAVSASGARVIVCTSVSLDHREYLGETVEEVLMEKIAPFRGGVLVVGKLPDHLGRIPVLRSRCKGGRVLFFGKNFFVYREGGDLNYVSDFAVSGINIGPRGSFQEVNCSLALTGVKALLDIEGMEERFVPRIVRKALASTRVPGRLELVERGPDVYLDVGHNPEASRTVASELFDPGDFASNAVLFTLPVNRNIVEFLAPFRKKVKNFVYVPLGGDFHSGEAALFASSLLGVKLRVEESVQDGLEAVRSLAGGDGTVLVIGSYHIVERYYRLAGKKPVYC